MKRNIITAVILILFLNIFIVSFYYSITSNVNLIDQLLKRNQITKEEKEYLKKKQFIIYGSDRSAPPLRYVDPDSGQYIGLIVDYANALSIELGIEIKMEPLVWDKALAKLEKGETDFSDMFKSKERAEKYLFSTPIYKLRGIIVTSVSNNSIKSITDLKNKIVAVPAGDFAIDFLKEKHPNQKFIFTDNNFSALKKLRDGFADAVVGDEPVLSYYLKKLKGRNTLKILPHPAYDLDTVFGFPKNEQMLVSIINKGLASLRAKGMMLKIQQKWLGITASFVQTQKVERIVIVLVIFTTIIILALYIYSQLNKALKREIARRTEELKLSRNELRATFDGLTHLMATFNENCELVNINKSFCKFMNNSPQNIFKKHCLSFEKKFFKDCSECIIKKTFKNNKIYKKEMSDKSGIYELSSYPIELHKSEVKKVLLMIKNITKEKLTDQKYHQENKMAAIGQLAAGMAHEIRNPLGLIRNYSYLLKHSTDQNNAMISKSLNQIETSVEKAGAIIDNLLNFSRLDDEDDEEEIYIYEFVNEILQLEKKLMLRQKIKYQIKCSKDISYKINREVLKHIVINLTSNAIDAMENGGQLFVEAKKFEKDLILTVSDTGAGIKKKNIENVFNPFFTTKKRGKGTGLGLYIVYSDIKRYGGQISVESEEGKGSKFTVKLPFSNGEENE